jgi:hypothetical protein
VEWCIYSIIKELIRIEFNNLNAKYWIAVKLKATSVRPDQADNPTAFFQDTDFEHPLLRNIFDAHDKKRI